MLRADALLYTGRASACVGLCGIVAGCGTYVEKAGEVLFYKRIEEEVLERTLKILKPYHYPVVLEGREYLYVDERYVCR